MISGMTSVALVVDIPDTSRIARFRISYRNYTSHFASEFVKDQFPTFVRSLLMITP